MAPQIFGHTLRINPLLVIFALLLGLQLYGIIGALVALPILSVLRETAVYLQPPPDARALGALAGAGCCERRAASRCSVRAALGKRYGELRGAARTSSFELRAGRAASRSSGPTAPARRRCCRSSPACSAPSAGSVRSRAGAREVGWVPQQPALYSQADGRREPELFARLERVADPRAAVARDARADRPARARRTSASERLSGGNRQRVNVAARPARRPAGARARRALRRRSTRASASGCGSSSAGSRAQGTSVLFSTHNVAEAERYADRVLVLDDGRLLFDGSPARAAARAARRRRRAATSSAALVALPRARAGAPRHEVAAAQGPADPAPLAPAGRACSSSTRSRSRC